MRFAASILIWLIYLGCATSEPPIANNPVEKETEAPVAPYHGREAIQPSSPAILSLLPENWILIAEAQGDINKDGITDLALVAQENDSSRIIPKPKNDFGKPLINANYRKLMIFWGNKKGNYTPYLENDSIILRDEEFTMSDPFENITLSEKGILQIYFNFWSNAGSWGTSNAHHTFRYQHNRMELIGFDYSYFGRNSGEMIDKSINFSTRKLSISYGSMENNEPDSVVWSDFTLNKLKNLETFGRPFTWSFMGADI